MTNPTLKLCPFCGGDAYTNYNYTDEHYVYCKDCAAQTGEHSTKSGAIETWNKRVINVIKETQWKQ